MDNMSERSFIFKKEFTTQDGTINEGRELRYVRGAWYLDGGMVPGSYYKLFKEMVTNEKLKDEYLTEVRVIRDKI